MPTEHIKKHSGYLVHGRVLDGPFEGEWIGSDTHHFVGHFQQPVRALYTGFDAGFELDRAIYKWLPSYRAWAWWQPQGATKKEKAGG